MINKQYVTIKLIKGLYLLKSRNTKTNEIQDTSRRYLAGLSKIKLFIYDSLSLMKLSACKKSKLNYREKLYVKGSKMVYRDLNIFAIIKQIQKLRAAVHVLIQNDPKKVRS